MCWCRGHISRDDNLTFLFIFQILYFSSHELFFPTLPPKNKRCGKKRRANTNPFNYVMCVILTLFFEGIKKNSFCRDDEKQILGIYIEREGKIECIKNELPYQR